MWPPAHFRVGDNSVRSFLSCFNEMYVFQLIMQIESEKFAEFKCVMYGSKHNVFCSRSYCSAYAII